MAPALSLAGVGSGPQISAAVVAFGSSYVAGQDELVVVGNCTAEALAAADCAVDGLLVSWDAAEGQLTVRMGVGG